MTEKAIKTVDQKTVAHEFGALTDTPANIRAWLSKENEAVRGKASLDKENEFDLPSGRHYAEKVLALKAKAAADWTKGDHGFAARVVNYAQRSGGIAEHHPHTEKAEVGDSGMTKNEIARRNWGLPARPKK